MNITATSTSTSTSTSTNTSTNTRTTASPSTLKHVLARAAQTARAVDRQTPTDCADFEHFERELHQLAQTIDNGDAKAEAALQQLLVRLQAHADPRCTGLLVFGSALAQRLSGGQLQDANLYLRRFEVPQIELFNLLGRCMPMAGLATRVANDALAQAMQGQLHPVVVDIGIGTGRQMVALMEGLAAAGRLPRQMTVVGIEPAAQALDAARNALFQTAARLGTKLSFHGFAACSEALSSDDWQALEVLCVTRPLINAAFALHHIADDAQGQDQRGRVLKRLHALDPVCLVLSEPDVNHLEPRFGARFENCFRHFGAVFKLLDGLDLSQPERDALKVGLFWARDPRHPGHARTAAPRKARNHHRLAAAAGPGRFRRPGRCQRAATQQPPRGHRAGPGHACGAEGVRRAAGVGAGGHARHSLLARHRYCPLIARTPHQPSPRFTSLQTRATGATGAHHEHPPRLPDPWRWRSRLADGLLPATSRPQLPGVGSRRGGR